LRAKSAQSSPTNQANVKSKPHQKPRSRRRHMRCSPKADVGNSKAASSVLPIFEDLMWVSLSASKAASSGLPILKDLVGLLERLDLFFALGNTVLVRLLAVNALRLQFFQRFLG